MVVCAAAAGLLVQFLLQQIEELCAVDDVVGQADAERVLSGHVIEQYRPKKRTRHDHSSRRAETLPLKSTLNDMLGKNRNYYFVV